MFVFVASGCGATAAVSEDDSVAQEEIGGFTPVALSKRVANARKAILGYWKRTFVHSPAWSATFPGRTWADVRDAVIHDTGDFGSSATEIVEGDHETLISGRVYGLYTEVTVKNNGRVVRVFVEID